MRAKVVKKTNPKEPQAAPRFYASAVHDVSINLDGLANTVASRCSLRRADVHGVLGALMDIIRDELAAGKVVTMGDLGSFCVNLKSEGAETQKEVTPGLVKGMKIVYRPAKELRKKLRMIDISIAN